MRKSVHGPPSLPRAIADVGLEEGEPGLVAVDPAYGDDHTHQGELPDAGEFGAGCDGVTVPPGCQSGREGGREGGREEQGEEGRKGGRVKGGVKEGSEGDEKEGSKTRNGEEREERRG